MEIEMIQEIEMAFCEVCGNVVPTVDVDGDLFCAYEYAEYPDIATIVGQSITQKSHNRCRAIGVDFFLYKLVP